MKNIMFLLAIFLLSGTAYAESFQPGTHYRPLVTPVATSTGDDKIEVVEVFWYGCPHCYSLEPTVEKWLENKPDNVEFVLIPGVLGKRWELDARVYYAAEVLGVLDKIHKPYFDAIHLEKRRMRNKEQVADFFVDLGVDKEAFLKTFDSFAVETKLRRSQQLVKRYKIRGVPAVIVNGKYEVTGSSAGSAEKIFEIVDYLVAQEEQAG